MTIPPDKSALLDSLRIERAPLRKSSRTPWIVAAAALLLLAGGAAYWFFWSDNGVPVHIVTAQTQGAGGASQGPAPRRGPGPVSASSAA